MTLPRASRGRSAPPAQRAAGCAWRARAASPQIRRRSSVYSWRRRRAASRRASRARAAAARPRRRGTRAPREFENAPLFRRGQSRVGLIVLTRQGTRRHFARVVCAGTDLTYLGFGSQSSCGVQPLFDLEAHSGGLCGRRRFRLSPHTPLALRRARPSPPTEIRRPCPKAAWEAAHSDRVRRTTALGPWTRRRRRRRRRPRTRCLGRPTRRRTSRRAEQCQRPSPARSRADALDGGWG